MRGFADSDYRAGVLTTLDWITDRQSRAPISDTHAPRLTTHDLKAERLHAEDLMDPAVHRSAVGPVYSGEYGLGVKCTIDWLLGDSMTMPSSGFGSSDELRHD